MTRWGGGFECRQSRPLQTAYWTEPSAIWFHCGAPGISGAAQIMKSSFIHIAFAVLVCAAKSASASESPVLKSGDTIAICGDSITGQKNYSDYVEEYFIACQPEQGLQASQFGWGGETSWGFRDRMANDVITFKPTVATLCYGMNDGDYSKTNPDRLAQYTEALTTTVRNFRKTGVREIVVGGPGPVDTTSFKGVFLHPISAEDYNHTLADFTRVAAEVAKKEGVRFTDIHAMGSRVMKEMKGEYGMGEVRGAVYRAAL